MATAQELLGSRTGLRRGLFGTTNARTLWDVRVDAQGDDPCEVVWSNYVPMGTPHPFAPEVVAMAWIQAEQHDHIHFFVEVEYGPPILLPSTSWNITYDTALETELVEFATLVDNTTIYPDVPIGPRVYLTDDLAYTASNADGTPTAEIAGLEAGDFFADTPDDAHIHLRRFSDRYARRVKGLERRKPIHQLILEATVTQLGGKTIADASTFATDVNKFEWFGYPPRTVQFIGPQIMMRTNTFVDGQPVTGVTFDVRLPFVVDRAGHQPVKFLETFRSENGEEVPVLNNIGVRQYTEYRPYAESDFNNLLNLFPLPAIDRNTRATRK